MAGDHTPLMPVLRWVLERFRDSGREASDVCLLMPCAPLVEAEHLRGAYDAYARSGREIRSDEHTPALQPLMRISYAVFLLKKTQRILEHIRPVISWGFR